MKDNYGRNIEYLRLSVTDKCNLNCSYCKRTVNTERTIITYEEIKKIIEYFSLTGIKKVRLTGGEPLVREDIAEIISLCKKEKSIKEVVMTTNGILLSEKAMLLKKAGLDRINISIDSLDEKKYLKIARANSIGKVFDGINAAIDAGLTPVKINAVLLKGKNDDEVDSLIELTKNKNIEMRFIEYMPMNGDINMEILSEYDIIKNRPQLVKEEKNNQDIANLYHIEGYIGKIGFISPMSQPFCRYCNRIRVTADCKIRYCLGNNGESDLREILKKDKETAVELIREIILKKPEKGFCEGFVTNRGMGNIGG